MTTEPITSVVEQNWLFICSDANVDIGQKQQFGFEQPGWRHALTMLTFSASGHLLKSCLQFLSLEKTSGKLGAIQGVSDVGIAISIEKIRLISARIALRPAVAGGLWSIAGLR